MVSNNEGRITRGFLALKTACLFDVPMTLCRKRETCCSGRFHYGLFKPRKF